MRMHDRIGLPAVLAAALTLQTACAPTPPAEPRPRPSTGSGPQGGSLGTSTQGNGGANANGNGNGNGSTAPVTPPGGSSGVPAFAAPTTFGLMVGVLEWADPSIPAFPDAKPNRQDRALETVLHQRGVDRQNLVFLEDRAATVGAIRAQLKQVARRATPGSTLLFYYAGHGGEDGSMSPYDESSSDESTWFNLREVVDVIRDDFKGDLVLLFGDMCYSGLFGRAAEEFQHPRIKMASITSVDPANTSTGNWTYTEAMVAGLSGKRAADGNGDGRITWSELSVYVGDRMWSVEGQTAGGGYSTGFDTDFIVSEVR